MTLWCAPSTSSNVPKRGCPPRIKFTKQWAMGDSKLYNWINSADRLRIPPTTIPIGSRLFLIVWLFKWIGWEAILQESHRRSNWFIGNPFSSTSTELGSAVGFHTENSTVDLPLNLAPTTQDVVLESLGLGRPGVPVSLAGTLGPVDGHVDFFSKLYNYYII